MSRRLPKPAVTAPIEDEPLPHPRRGRWLALLVALLLLAAVRLWWGWVANHRLQAAIDELHAQGEPVTAEDLADPAVPDMANAVFFARRAGQSFQLTPEQYNNATQGLYEVPLSAAGVAATRQLLDANRAALADVRHARELRTIYWEPLRLGRLTDVIAFTKDLGRLQSLSDLLQYAIRYQHVSGDDAAAIESVRDVLFLSQVIDRRATIVNHLIAISVTAVADAEIRGVAPDLRVGTKPLSASPSQVRSVIAELLDADSARRGLVRSIQGERPLALSEARGRLGEPDRHFAMGYGDHGELRLSESPAWLNVAVDAAVRPFYVLRASRHLRRSGANVLAAHAVDHPSSPYFPPPSPPGPPGMFGVDWVTGPKRDNNLARFFNTHRQGVAGNAQAAVALAARLFEVDKGRPPTSVAELVPGYLPAAPAGASLPSRRPAPVPTSAPATAPAG